MDSDEIQVASSPPPAARRRDSPFQDAKVNTKPVAAPTVMKRFKIPKGTKFSTPNSLDSDKDLKDDLKDLGFSAKRVKELVAKQEPVVDGHGQIPQGQVVKPTEEEKEAATRSERLQRGNKGKYEHLYLTEGTNWVLFDPLRGYPKQAGDPPELFQKLETYKPGNAKILEYNTVSESVRIRSLPKVLDGRDVQYLPNGPRLVEYKTGGRKKRAKVVIASSEVENSEPEEDGFEDSYSLE
ncbi:hypothetical protein LTR85_005987 [Meristemomyces frigidus]|nr:hypothetical protein LTR85_005987 [Meristemomyces frigidus]